MRDNLTKILAGIAALAALGLGGAALAGATGGGNKAPAAEASEASEANEPAENSAGEDTDNVQDENGKDDASEGDEGGNESEAGGDESEAGGDESEAGSSTVTAADAERAKQAALAETGGGKANSVERDGENGAVYEVEVTKSNGSTVDVRLDGDYKVVVVEDDAESGHQD